MSGTDAVAWGLIAGARAAGIGRVVFGSYPITPASSILHSLAALKAYGVLTFQAEDEIAAICSAIGASFAGALGVTSSSGPGVALKTEALGLAITTELPLVLINSQRFTKTANCWGVDNGRKGTNTNRVVVFRKPESPD